jgi:hypothetical protein
MNVADKNRAIESTQLHGSPIDADLYPRLLRLGVNVQDHSIETKGLVNLRKGVDDALGRDSS